MERWGWLIGYVIVFALLHLLLYYVYVRRADGDEARSPSLADPNRGPSHASRHADRYTGNTDGSGDASDAGDPSARNTDRELDGETMRCPHCGAQNVADQTYTYCWNCVTTLRR